MKQFLYAALLAASLPAAAQRPHFGLEAGLQLGNFTEKYLSSSSSGTGVQAGKVIGDVRPGIRAGLVVDGPVGRNFSLQWGVYFSQKGTSDPGSTGKVRVSFVEVPLLLLARAPIGRGHLFLGGGPFVALAIGGKATGYIVTPDRDLTFGNTLGSDFRLFDAGILVTGGYELQPGFFVRGFVNPSLTNAEPLGTTNSSIRYWGYGFSLGYFLQ